MALPLGLAKLARQDVARREQEERAAAQSLVVLPGPDAPGSALSPLSAQPRVAVRRASVRLRPARYIPAGPLLQVQMVRAAPPPE